LSSPWFRDPLARRKPSSCQPDGERKWRLVAALRKIAASERRDRRNRSKEKWGGRWSRELQRPRWSNRPTAHRRYRIRRRGPTTAVMPCRLVWAVKNDGPGVTPTLFSHRLEYEAVLPTGWRQTVS
jgi:hypothetical protein